MNELKTLKNDFISIINAAKTDIDKELLINQLKGVTENYFDYLEGKLEK